MARFDPFSLDCLAAVADEGGFLGAARRLGVSQSAVSQRIKALERAVGELLIVRTRPVSLTAAGTVVLRYARRLAALQDDLTDSLGQARGRGGLPIAVNADSLATWLLGALQPLVDDGLDLEIAVDDESRTIERFRRGEVLGCVSTREKPVLGANVWPLGAIRYRAVASPAFAARHLPGGLTRRTLATTPFLVFGPHDPLQHRWVEEALKLPNPLLRQRFVPSSEAYFQACLRGWGVAIVPTMQCDPAIDRGELTVVHGHQISVPLHWHAWPSGAVSDEPDGPDDEPPAGAAGAAAPIDVLARVGHALMAVARTSLHPPDVRHHRTGPTTA